MLTTPLDQITEAALRDFVSKARMPETASLDYKRDYDLGDPKGKKSLLTDICAFANNGGGIILVGVDEERDGSGQKSGLPVAQPSGSKKFDKSIAEDVIHASIEPRLGSFVRIHTVHGTWPDGPVHVIRIERTWNSPHCVRASEQRSFYRRSGAKSEPMDMNQIRDAFVGSNAVGDRAVELHRSRVKRVMEGKLTFPLSSKPGRSVVHVVPLSFFASGERLLLSGLPLLCPSSGSGGWNPIPNFDGRIAYAGRPEATSYIQVFRHGVVEGVNTDLLHESEGSSRRICLRVRQIELDVLRTAEQARIFFESQSALAPPYLVMVSIVGIEGSYIPPPSPSYDASHVHKIELDHLEFPDVQIDDLKSGVPQLLRPTFDMLWQSSGWPKSLSFDAKGQFTTPMN